MTDADICASLLERISAYLDGDLNAADCAMVERHAATCATCAQVIADFRATTGLCRKAAEAPLPEAVRDKARARIAALLGKTSTGE
jgi:anti-sigma factor RsiW